jgi:threonine dehydrogenase-like Zn-dependent dehydrogenase
LKTKAVRIHGVNDLRLEEFELPQIRDNEILAEVVSDSICMSSHKFAMQGSAHKRVREDLARRPVIIGHEFCGVLVEVGKKWRGKFKAGEKFAIQPAGWSRDDDAPPSSLTPHDVPQEKIAKEAKPHEDPAGRDAFRRLTERSRRPIVR